MLRNFTHFLPVPATLRIPPPALSPPASRTSSPGLPPPCPPPQDNVVMSFCFSLRGRIVSSKYDEVLFLFSPPHCTVLVSLVKFGYTVAEAFICGFKNVFPVFLCGSSIN